MRFFLAVLLAITSLAASAFQPRTGHWNDPAEPGRGFNIDIQDGVMVLTVYAYDASGSAQWYIASGTMTNGQRNFTGALAKFINGQCVACNYSAPVANGNDGAVSVAFASETLATVTLPGAHVTTIRPFNFRFGEPPLGLLGEWVFVYDVITTFADRFDFTSVQTATTNGNGIALNSDGTAACELQIVGVLAGTVVCAEFTPSGAVQNGYSFIFGLDETFSGSWISPTTSTFFPMKGFKVKSPGGFTKAAKRETLAETAAHRESMTGTKARQAEASAGTPASPELLRALDALARQPK